MKILLVTETIPGPQLGGLAKHVVALGNALISQGHDVVLMGRNAPSYESCADEIGFNGLFIPGFSDPFKGWKEKRFGVFMPGKRSWYARKMAQGMLSHAHRFDVIHYHGLHPMIGRFIPRNIPFVQTRHDQGSDCIIYTRFRKGKVCTERSPQACGSCMHDNPGFFRKRISATAVTWLRRDVELAFSRHPVIFVSNFLRENYQKTIPTPGFIRDTVCHNFVDEKRLKAIRMRQDRSTVDDGRFVVHVAGRMDGTKGIGAFLRILAPRLPSNWTVNVFGDGPDRAALLRELKHERIIFHGHLAYDLTIEASARADVVVVPSLCEESCSTVILEALKLDRHCMALERGGSSELLPYGSEGQLSLYKDLNSLVNALLSKSVLEPNGAGQSADVAQRIPEIVAVYREAMKGRSRNAS